MERTLFFFARTAVEAVGGNANEFRPEDGAPEPRSAEATAGATPTRPRVLLPTIAAGVGEAGAGVGAVAYRASLTDDENMPEHARE